MSVTLRNGDIRYANGRRKVAKVYRIFKRFPEEPRESICCLKLKSPRRLFEVWSMAYERYARHPCLQLCDMMTQSHLWRGLAHLHLVLSPETTSRTKMCPTPITHIPLRTQVLSNQANTTPDRQHVRTDLSAALVYIYSGDHFM